MAKSGPRPGRGREAAADEAGTDRKDVYHAEGKTGTHG
jgi:hypothetical protein